MFNSELFIDTVTIATTGGSLLSDPNYITVHNNYSFIPHTLNVMVNRFYYIKFYTNYNNCNVRSIFLDGKRRSGGSVTYNLVLPPLEIYYDIYRAAESINPNLASAVVGAVKQNAKQLIDTKSRYYNWFMAIILGANK